MKSGPASLGSWPTWLEQRPGSTRLVLLGSEHVYKSKNLDHYGLGTLKFSISDNSDEPRENRTWESRPESLANKNKIETDEPFDRIKYESFRRKN